MAGHRLSRGPCPRCGRDCAIINPLESVPVRHKDGEQWCNGEPKRSVELVLEILDSLSKERAMLRYLTDAYVEFGTTLVDTTDAVHFQQEITSGLINQAAAAVRAERDALQEKLEGR